MNVHLNAHQFLSLQLSINLLHLTSHDSTIKTGLDMEKQATKSS